MRENKQWRDRLADDRTKDAKEIDDWMHGGGSKVFAVVLIAPGGLGRRFSVLEVTVNLREGRA